MFSPMVSAPLMCAPGRISIASYCEPRVLEAARKRWASAAVHQSASLPWESNLRPSSSKPCDISWPITAPMAP